MFTMKP